MQWILLGMLVPVLLLLAIVWRLTSHKREPKKLKGK